MHRSRHRGNSAGASGSETSGVTTRHCGVSSAPAPPDAARRRGRSGGRGGGGGRGLLLHARGRRAFRGAGAFSSSSATAAGAGSDFTSSGSPTSSSSRFAGDALPSSSPLASSIGASDRGSASMIGLVFGWEGEPRGEEAEAIGGGKARKGSGGGEG
jgi:hypothetical protein